MRNNFDKVEKLRINWGKCVCDVILVCVCDLNTQIYQDVLNNVYIRGGRDSHMQCVHDVITSKHM